LVDNAPLWPNGRNSNTTRIFTDSRVCSASKL
jgi:hypothetical protein